MSVKIKFQRIIVLDPSNLTDKTRDFYNELVKELKEQIKYENITAEHKWHIHVEQKSQLYSKLNAEMNRLIVALYSVNRGMVVRSNARGNRELTFTYKGVELAEYNWGDNAHFKLSFESEDYMLLDKFGTLVLLTPMTDGISTFLLDLGANEDISISSYSNTPQG